MKALITIRAFGIALIFCTAMAILCSAQLTTLHSFAGADGAHPYAGLLLSSDGNYYGTTVQGGTSGAGSVFKITPSGTLTTLHSFNGSDGLNPYVGLVPGNDGNFYGTTTNGGYHSIGEVFKITPGGTLTVLHFFNYTYGDGGYPGGLVLGRDGNLYGTTSLGGDQNKGTFFVISPDGSRFATLYGFESFVGSNPTAALVQGGDGNFYGTAPAGGANASGTVFKITPGGTPTLLYSFCSQPNCTDGASPSSSLLLASDGNFYGTTYGGGDYQFGAVFKITPSGAVTKLHSFDRIDGRNPLGALVQAHDGNFYGTTAAGGTQDVGTIFRMTPAGVLTSLYSFKTSDGSNPDSGLVQGNDGKFYGTTNNGGANNDGTVFELQLSYSTLTVTTSGSGTVTSSDGHINCGPTCSYPYLSGSNVTLTATPAQGWVFTSWSGCDTVNGNVCTVTMNNNRNVTATFTILYQLSVSKVGSGTVTSSDGHINCGATCSYLYKQGDQVTLTATPAQGWVFTSWSGCDTVNGNVCTVTMNNNRNVTATFTITYQLSASKVGSGTVTSSDGNINCGSTCSYTYPNGTQVTLTATPAQGWNLISWSGCDQVNGLVCTVTLYTNRNVTATFAILYMLSVSVNGNGTVVSGGVDCGSICSHMYQQGTQVKLTAVPGAGSTLSSWAGCDTMQGDYCTVTMSSARSVAATFAVAQVALASLPLKPASVTAEQLSIGTVTLSAAAPPGGVGVAVSSDKPRVAHPPALVIVPGGAKSAIFVVRTWPVWQKTFVHITATANSSHISTMLTVNPK